MTEQPEKETNKREYAVAEAVRHASSDISRSIIIGACVIGASLFVGLRGCDPFERAPITIRQEYSRPIEVKAKLERDYVPIKVNATVSGKYSEPIRVKQE